MAGSVATQDELDEIKLELRCIIISHKGSRPLNVRQLLQEYENNNGETMPTFNFKSPIRFLQSLTESIVVHGSDDSSAVTAVPNEKSKHIVKLIANERRPKKRTNYFSPSGKPLPPRPVPSGIRASLTPVPLISQPLIRPSTAKTNLMQLPPRLQQVTSKEPLAIIRPRIPRPQQISPEVSRTRSIEDSMKGVRLSDDDKLRYSLEAASTTKIDNECFNFSFNSSSSPSTSFASKDQNDDDKSIAHSELIDLESEVPVRVQNNLINLCIKFKVLGIWLSELPRHYEETYGYSLDYHSYGYNGLYAMVSSLNKIFRMVRPTKSDWKVFCAFFPPFRKELLLTDSDELINRIPENIKLNVKKLLCKVSQNSILLDDVPEIYEATYGYSLDYQKLGFDDLTSFIQRIRREDELAIGSQQDGSDQIDFLLSNKCLIGTKEFIPDDIVKPNQQLPPLILDGIAVGKYVDTVIAEIFSPAKFYLQLRNKAIELEKMMEEMNQFYETNPGKYRMPLWTICPGNICAAKYKDYGWHRVVIESCGEKTAWCFYVDYGSRWCLKNENLRFLHKSFAILRMQAFEAKLADIRPLEGEKEFSTEASRRFLQLAQQNDVVAGVIEFDSSKNWVSVALIDTLGAEDVNYAEVLEAEGLVRWVEDEETTSNLERTDSSENIFPLDEIPSFVPENMKDTSTEETAVKKENLLVSPPPYCALQSRDLYDINDKTSKSASSPPPPYTRPPPGFNSLPPSTITMFEQWQSMAYAQAASGYMDFYRTQLMYASCLNPMAALSAFPYQPGATGFMLPVPFAYPMLPPYGIYPPYASTTSETPSEPAPKGDSPDKE